MSTLENAIRIAVTAHAGQTDKGGAAYITHPLRLVAAVESEEAKIVAVLHDVVEDTNVTIEDLRREGFGEGILEGVHCVTHRRDEPYADYVVGCKKHAVARLVKLADLADNSRLDRCILRIARVERDFARIHRYVLSYKFLTDQLSESDYRSLMKTYGELESERRGEFG
jgi:(p)ppGpp synthase/HD superfamily hydrolase